ncbi:MAG: glycosyltransferase family 4 protein [Acidobacteriales bacterium]|nr:glycosyltransferase family 4 protein [Terriglobales bacterium]
MKIGNLSQGACPMRVCMVLHDPQPFGGLEEYAVALALCLQQKGHSVSVLSSTWVPPDNQYVQRLQSAGIPCIQVPRWLSRPASHWPTKMRVLSGALMALTPLTCCLAVVLCLTRRTSWKQARASATNRLRQFLLAKIIARNYYRSLSLVLLEYWRLRWRPDIIHVHGYTTSLLFVVRWAHARRIPVVYEEHATPDSKYDWWSGFHKVINEATTVIAVSQKSAEGLRTVCGVTRPVAVVNGPLTDPCSAVPPSEKRGDNEHTGLVVTTIARLIEVKGLNHLLDAIVEITAEHPTTLFRIHGGGPLLEELLAYSHQRGLNGAEIFVGPFHSRDELDRIMGATDVFVLPSLLEGQPLALVEAMAYGRPIVATAVGGVPELIQDGINGLLCRPADSKCLASCISRLLGDQALRGRLGRAARQSFEEGPFSPDAVCTAITSIYRDSLENRPLSVAAEVT